MLDSRGQIARERIYTFPDEDGVRQLVFPVGALIPPQAVERFGVIEGRPTHPPMPEPPANATLPR